MTEAHAILSRRYATAFFTVYHESLTLADAQVFKQASIFLRAHAAALAFFEVPHVSDEQQHAMIDVLIKQTQISPVVKPLLLLLSAHKRMNVLPDVCGALSNCLFAYHQVLPFVITSFPALQEPERVLLDAFLERSTGKKILSQYGIDNNLIAGIRAESSGLLWEYSLEKKLRDARHMCLSGDNQ